jgi:leucyl aminopeptidase
MNLYARKRIFKFKNTDTVALFLSEQGAKDYKKALPPEFHFIRAHMDRALFKGKQAEVLFLPFAENPAVIVCGLGKDEEIDGETLRKGAAKVIGLCRDKSIAEIHIIPPDIASMEPGHVLSSLAEGAYLANYSFDKYKTKKTEDGEAVLKRALFYTDAKDADPLLAKIKIVCGNTLLCRDLVNETSDKSDSRWIALQAKALAKLPGVSCTVYGRKEIEKMKMGLLLAVNKGSTRPPQFAVLTYRGDKKSKKFLALVGKGITFDSGGMNLKPTGHIEDMRVDMAGAAAVLFAFKSAAELRLKKNIYALLPLTDNMLSNDSYRPGDVFRAYNGMNVEIGNTDAEGRLVLADALAFAEKKLKPDSIVDIATLTGACVATFGEYTAGYLTPDDDLARLLEDSGTATGDRVWRLPLLKDYEDNLKSDIADITNISSEKNAGTIIGAVFLKSFVSTARWAHIDIAGTARYTKPRGYRPKNATGYGVRLLVELISRWAG